MSDLGPRYSNNFFKKPTGYISLVTYAVIESVSAEGMLSSATAHLHHLLNSLHFYATPSQPLVPKYFLTSAGLVLYWPTHKSLSAGGEAHAVAWAANVAITGINVLALSVSPVI